MQKDIGKRLDAEEIFDRTMDHLRKSGQSERMIFHDVVRKDNELVKTVMDGDMIELLDKKQITNRIIDSYGYVFESKLTWVITVKHKFQCSLEAPSCTPGNIKLIFTCYKPKIIYVYPNFRLL